MKKAGRKCPDRLADSCKRSSVNRMAAGSRLSWCIMDFFSYLHLFKHTLSSELCMSLTGVIGPGVLLTLHTVCAVKT